MSVDVPKDGFVDYYALLGVDPSATVQEIRLAFLKQAKLQHPDAGGSTDAMQALNKAYKTLVGETSRPAYDKMYDLHHGRGPQLDLKDDYKVPSAVGDDDIDDDDRFIDELYSEYFDVK